MSRSIRSPLALALALACALVAVEAGAADARDLGDIEPAESRGPGATAESSPAESAGVWQPPDCDELTVDLPDTPPAHDSSGWSALLANARKRVADARSRLDKADADYTRARNRQYPRGDAHGAITTEREAARREYAEARCALPALLDSARRSGAPPEVWRD